MHILYTCGTGPVVVALQFTASESVFCLLRALMCKPLNNHKNHCARSKSLFTLEIAIVVLESSRQLTTQRAKWKIKISSGNVLYEVNLALSNCIDERVFILVPVSWEYFIFEKINTKIGSRTKHVSFLPQLYNIFAFNPTFFCKMHKNHINFEQTNVCKYRTNVRMHYIFEWCIALSASMPHNQHYMLKTF